jgi:peroxiredoxin family protein
LIGIIVHSGEFDRIYHALTLASMYSALEKKVAVFLTYWCLDTLAKRRKDCGDERKNEIFREGMESGKIKELDEVVELGKSFGNLEILACSGSMEIFGYELSELPKWVDRIAGLGEFLMGVEGIIFI